MKKLYTLTLAALGFAAISFGQRTVDLSIELTNHEPGSEKAPGVYTLEFSVTNNGPDDIEGGDILWFGYFIGDQLYDFDGTPNGVNGIQIPDEAPNITSGQSLPWAVLSPTFGTITVDVSDQTTPTDICAFILPGMGEDPNAPTVPDPVNTNNFSCFDINPALANIEDVVFNEVINIFSTENTIEISSELNETLTYNVVNLTGQVVATGDFNSFVSVPTSGMNNGIYIVNVMNGTEAKTIKVAINK